MTDLSDRHTGDVALGPLLQAGVDIMFTLNGGHVWPLYDAASKAGMRIVDTRHEQTAVWAAEAWAKLTRGPGLAVLTAGPGVTNGVSAITSAFFNGSPLVVLGGRAPQGRWGAGSLQEIDHLPIVSSVTKMAATAFDSDQARSLVAGALRTAMEAHRGPVFVDFPMDVLFSPVSPPAGTSAATSAAAPGAGAGRRARTGADPRSGDQAGGSGGDIGRVAELIARAERPGLIVGSDVYWAGAWESLRRAAEAMEIPCYANGMGRGCLPGDHRLAFSRTRSMLSKEADLVVVAGTPLDFRLNFGRFGEARVVHLVDSPEAKSPLAPSTASVAGDLAAAFEAIAAWNGPVADHSEWVSRLRDAESAHIAADLVKLRSESNPIKPTRVFGELNERLDRDAVVICDGGDFASYAGKYVTTFTPGCWLDTGPYGCLGNGLGYAAAARLARPDSQVVAVLGDGAAGFALGDLDTLVRHQLPAVLIVGNNGIWGLEKHPMRAVYGYDVACDLRPGTRYDLVAQALGADGETVTDPAGIGPALDRAFASKVPYVVNVLTDPDDQYPRSSNLG
ncbi:MAG: acetolactate synthase [Acidimicrobiales bacterium]